MLRNREGVMKSLFGLEEQAGKTGPLGVGFSKYRQDGCIQLDRARQPAAYTASSRPQREHVATVFIGLIRSEVYVAIVTTSETGVANL